MKTLGTLLIVLSVLIFLAGVGERFGPALQEQGIPFSGSLVPWGLWIPVGVVSLIVGVLLRRRAVRKTRPNANSYPAPLGKQD